MSKNDAAPRIGAAFRACDGGGRRDRTDDLLLAKQALSQLSYAPGSFACAQDKASVGATSLHPPIRPLRREPAVPEGRADRAKGGGPGRI